MSPDVERAIIHSYPQRALTSPRYEYDATFTALKALLADLKKLDPRMQPGTRGRYDIAEEVLLFGDLRLLLSYLGPFAAIDPPNAKRSEDEDERERRVTRALEDHGTRLLSRGELAEAVPWIDRKGTTVFECLFVPPKG